MTPLCWQLAVLLVISSLALANNLCNESSLLSAGSAHHFTNCLNISFPSIPSSDFTLIVEDSTVAAVSLNTSLLSLISVTLRFTRCTILSDLSLSSGGAIGLVVRDFTVELISCSITFDTAAVNEIDGPAMFLVIANPQGVDNLWIRMANSTLNLTGVPSMFERFQSDFGLLNVFQDRIVSQLHNISVIIEDCRVDLLYAALAERDDAVVLSQSDPSLVRFASYREDNSSFVKSISDMYLSFRNITGRMQGSTGTILVRSEGILNRLSIHVSGVTLQMASYGPYSNRSMQRLGVLVLLSDSPCNGCTVEIVDSQLYFTSVAGSLTQIENATMLRELTSAFVAIAVPPSAAAADGTVLPSLLSTITLRNCHLVSYNMGGQFSYIRATIKSTLVDLSPSSNLYNIMMTESTVNATVRLACPYRRMVRLAIDAPMPCFNTSSLALIVVISLIYLAFPIRDVTVTMINSSVTANATTMAKCQGASSAVVSYGFDVPVDFSTSIMTFLSSVTCADEEAAYALALSAFASVSSLLTLSAPSVRATVANTNIALVNVTMLNDFHGGSSSGVPTTDRVQSILSHGLLASYRGDWNNCSVDIAQTQLHTPAMALTSSLLRDTNIIVTGPTLATVVWLSKDGPQDAVTSVHLFNVSCSAAGCGTSSITVRDFLLFVDVVSSDSGGGLVALLNGSDVLLSGVAWRFSDIHVKVRRRSVPFVLFAVNVATVNDPLVDVSLSCVSWNGLRTVPLVGSPLARMFQDSVVPGGCVFPAAPTFSQTFVAPVVHSVTNVVALSRAISVVSYAVVAVSGARGMAALQQAVSQHASMRRMCAAELSSGDEGDSPPLMSSYIDNPLQVRIGSFGSEMEYVGGSIVGNLCFAVVLLVVNLFVTALVCALDGGTSFGPATMLKGLMSRRFGLPGAAWAPFCAVCQSIVAACVASLQSVAGLLLLSVVVLALTIVTLVFLFAVPLAWQPIPVVVSPRRSLSPKGKLHALEWVFAPMWQWRATKVEPRCHNGRGPPRAAPEGSASLRFMDRYEELLSVYCRDRHWFFAVEAAVPILSGVVNGLSMGLRPNVVCGAQWAFSAALLLLLACQVITVIVLQPYNVRADAVVSVGSALLSAASIVVLMVSAAGGHLVDAVGAILMVQSLVGMLSVASLTHRIVTSTLRLKRSAALSNDAPLERWVRMQRATPPAAADASSSERALRSLVIIVCVKRIHV